MELVWFVQKLTNREKMLPQVELQLHLIYLIWVTIWIWVDVLKVNILGLLVWAGYREIMKGLAYRTAF